MRFVLRIPLLRVRRIRDNGVKVQGVVGIDRVLIIKVGPIIFEGVGISSDDVAGQDAAHDKIHAGEVVGVFLQLLGVILDVALVSHVLGNGLANI